MEADELSLELAQPEIGDRLHWFQLDRRDFLKLCGGGLLVCLAGASGSAQESGRGFREHELPQEVSAWIHIDEDEKITIFTGKVEVGQNIRTSLAQLVAEELRVPFNRITMVMGHGNFWESLDAGHGTTAAHYGFHCATNAGGGCGTAMED
jgi:isoquinoline 1-oxidoreductase